jgi:hypothetical protein
MSKYHVTEYSVGQVIEQLHYGKFEVVRVCSKPTKEKHTGFKQEILSLLMNPVLSLLIKLNHSHHSLEGTVFYLARNA